MEATPGEPFLTDYFATRTYLELKQDLWRNSFGLEIRLLFRCCSLSRGVCEMKNSAALGIDCGRFFSGFLH